MDIVQCLSSIVIPDVLVFIINIAGLLVIFFTLKEMIKARQESYKPKIYIKTKKIFLQSNDISTGYIWKETVDDVYKTSEYPIENNYNLELENVGLGAALSLIVKFEYKYTEIMGIIHKYLNEYPDDIKLADHELEMISSYGSCKYPFFSNDEFFVCHRKYLLPVASNSTKLLITLPTSFILLLNSIVHFEQKKEKVMKLPKIAITIECKDISGKKYVSKNHIVFTGYYLKNNCLIIEKGLEIVNKNTCVMEMHQE